MLMVDNESYCIRLFAYKYKLSTVCFMMGQMVTAVPLRWNNSLEFLMH
jgi:hypothetical protein